MKNLLKLLALSAAGLSAQTVETIPFRAFLSPQNEVPAITNVNASGVATLFVHVMRDAQGEVVSASVDWNVSYQFPGAVTITGLHIHRGRAGENGPVTVDTGISGTRPREDPAGNGAVVTQVQVTPASTTALATVRDMLNDPDGFYVNLHTTTNPGGVIRGQVQIPQRVVLMGIMSPNNEVPAIQGLDAHGVGLITAFVTRDAEGSLTSALVRFDVRYTFPANVTLSGLHIHTGSAGENGPVTIGTPLRSTPTTSPTGIVSFDVEADLTNAATREAVERLFRNPAGLYVNIHTTDNPGGAMRGQLRNTDAVTFQNQLSPRNEVPAITDLDAGAGAATTVRTLRDNEGEVTAAAVTFDINHRFPGTTRFTGLHIHDESAGANGPVTVPTAVTGTNAVDSETGFGNIYSTVLLDTPAYLNSVKSILQNPERHYVNLHTTVNPGGAVRSQLAPANNALPTVGAVISAVSDPALTTLSPGGLVAVYGENLTKVAGDSVNVDGPSLPVRLNGSQILMNGQALPIVSLSAGSAVVQLPELITGTTAEIGARNANGLSARPLTVRVAEYAPAIFFDQNGGVAFKQPENSFIGADNPVRAGDMIAVFGTGFGRTNPPFPSGNIAPATPAYNTAQPVTATLGGRPATVVSARLWPGLVGVTQIVVRVPEGLAPTDNAALVLSIAGVNSNTVRIPVR